MHKVNTHLKTATFIVFALSSQIINSQVTIGSPLPAAKGALLDIKEHSPDQNNSSATRGMTLPKVKLENINSLIPLINNEPSETEKLIHKGVTVYNSDICFPGGAGLFSWDGNKWNQIGNGNFGKDKTSFNETTGILTDFEGNEYKTAVFGTKRWMTTNLKSLRNSDGSPISCEAGAFLNPGYSSNSTGAIKIGLSIPEGYTNTYTEANIEVKSNLKTYDAFSSTYGLSYTKESAESICPNGWHLATKQEWYDLINYMQTNYSTNYLSSMKANINTTYKSVEGISYNWTNGENAPISGFDILPSGWVRDDGKTASGFGNSAYFWAGKDDYVYAGSASKTLSFFPIYTSNFHFSVRCVQD